MFTPKANSKQKRAKKWVFSSFDWQEIWARFRQFGARFLSNQSWKISSEFGARFWQFGARFWTFTAYGKDQFSLQKPNFWSPNHPKWIRTMFTGLVYIIGVKQPIFIQLNNMFYHKLSSNITSQTLNLRTTISSIFKLYIKIIERNPTLTLIQQHQTTSYRNRFLPSSLLASSRFSLQNQFSSNVFTWKCFSPFFFLLLQKYLSFLFSPNSLNFY